MALNDKFLVAIIVATAVILVTISTTTAQKSGSCPPPLPVQICFSTCYVDEQCQGIGKCCPTNCGGTICSRPVTMRNPNAVAVKPGFCPAIPTGRWVCTPTCSRDSDCRGTRKCCKNRCGAMACQKPEESPEPPVDVPFNENPFRVFMN